MMAVRGSYILYRRTRDGRLRHWLRLPGWLPAALAALVVAGGLHLAWRIPEIISLRRLDASLDQARQHSAFERARLLAAHERLAGLRRNMDPIMELGGKLAVVTNLAESSSGGDGRRGMGSAAVADTGMGNEKRLGRQLVAAARALVEEAAFQEGRQRKLASILRERALEFAARPSLWPVRGALNSDFGYRFMGRSRDHHNGVDIGVPVGSPVVAPADGKVLSAGYESGYGLVVVLEHRHGVTTVFAHLKSALVEPGQEVSRGQRIAHSGMSGRTTGSHLHYEVRLSGQPVDPMNYMLN